uniref:Bromo domain-containing protein n=1 Tax=Macrostomum lignano TaxID=282301 RepID=A0A1I8F2B6_9PLAT
MVQTFQTYCNICEATASVWRGWLRPANISATECLLLCDFRGLLALREVMELAAQCPNRLSLPIANCLFFMLSNLFDWLNLRLVTRGISYRSAAAWPSYTPNFAPWLPKGIAERNLMDLVWSSAVWLSDEDSPPVDVLNLIFACLSVSTLAAHARSPALSSQTAVTTDASTACGRGRPAALERQKANAPARQLCREVCISDKLLPLRRLLQPAAAAKPQQPLHQTSVCCSLRQAASSTTHYKQSVSSRLQQILLDASTPLKPSLDNNDVDIVDRQSLIEQQLQIIVGEDSHRLNRLAGNAASAPSSHQQGKSAAAKHHNCVTVSAPRQVAFDLARSSAKSSKLLAAVGRGSLKAIGRRRRRPVEAAAGKNNNKSASRIVVRHKMMMKMKRMKRMKRPPNMLDVGRRRNCKTEDAGVIIDEVQDEDYGGDEEEGDVEEEDDDDEDEEEDNSSNASFYVGMPRGTPETGSSSSGRLVKKRKKEEDDEDEERRRTRRKKRRKTTA